MFVKDFEAERKKRCDIFFFFRVNAFHTDHYTETHSHIYNNRRATERGALEICLEPKRRKHPRSGDGSSEETGKTGGAGWR